MNLQIPRQLCSQRTEKIRIHWPRAINLSLMQPWAFLNAEAHARSVSADLCQSAANHAAHVCSLRNPKFFTDQAAYYGTLSSGPIAKMTSEMSRAAGRATDMLVKDFKTLPLPRLDTEWYAKSDIIYTQS